MHQKSNTCVLGTRDCRQAMLMVQYLVNLLKDGPHMHCNHLVYWVYGSRHICHPRNFSRCIIADITGQLLQKREKHPLAKRKRIQQQYPMQINLEKVVTSCQADSPSQAQINTKEYHPKYTIPESTTTIRWSHHFFVELQ